MFFFPRPGLSCSLDGRALLAILVLAPLLAASSPPPPNGKPKLDQSDASKPLRHTQPAPKPGALDKEAAHVARYDAAIREVRELQISAVEATQTRDAIRSVGKGDIIGAKALASGLSEGPQRKLVEWYALFRGYGSAQDYFAFINANPTWPAHHVLKTRFEARYFDDLLKGGAGKIGLDGWKPVSGAGLGAQALLAQAMGKNKEAESLARRAWREFDFPQGTEKSFLERFGKVISVEDHKWRADRLLGAYVRWRSHRSGRIAAAGRLIPLLDAGEQTKLKARIAAFREAGNAGTLLRKLPADKTPDWGLAFNRVQVLRRSGKRLEAQKILLSVPADPKVIANPDGWWHERFMAALVALKEGQPATAYDLIKEAGPLSANEANDQAFFSGWIALRHLKRPKQALAHFASLEKTADGPLSRSRAAYWLGRTHEVLGGTDKARAYYAAAVKFGDTFDAHLARSKLGAESQSIEIQMPAEPSQEQIRTFNTLDSVKAAVIAAKIGLGSEISRHFLTRLRMHFESEAELGMLAHLAEALGDTQMAVRIGKTAHAQGHNLTVYSYPVHAFPAYSPLRPPPETAMLLAIARQETEFSTMITSSAGARGLMQVMPVTARHVCRDYKITCSVPRLSTDRVYNTTLASAYIGDRMKEFDGNYIMTIAGYNAGPGRVRQWIGEFGDPRQPGVDPIDWIHRIPFEETRLYVQKVLSNVQIYRARLAPGATRVRIVEDMGRTGPRRRAEITPAAQSATAE